MATVTFDKATRHLPGQRPAPRSTSSTSTSPTASSSSSSAPPAAASPPPCACSPASKRSTTGDILIGDRDVTDLSAQGPRHRDGLPELRALPAHDGRREHGLRAEDRRRRQGRDRASGSRRPPRSSTSSQYLERKPKALSGGQRQRVAMGRAIVRSAAGLPHGRAAVQPRRQAARADPHPDRLAAAPPRRHHRLRHARPGRGHDDGRPDRGAQGRPAAAGRHPARACTTTRTTSSSPASSARRR